MSFTRFEPECSSSGRQFYIQVCHSMFYMRRYKQSSAYKTAYTDACKTHYAILVYTIVFLKKNSRVRNA